MSKMDPIREGKVGYYPRQQVQAALIKKRAETDPSLPYVTGFPSSSHEGGSESTFLMLGDVVTLFADSEEVNGFISTLGYVFPFGSKGDYCIYL